MSQVHGGAEVTLQERILNDEDIDRLIEDAVLDIGPIVVDGASLSKIEGILEKLVYKAIREWTGEE